MDILNQKILALFVHCIHLQSIHVPSIQGVMKMSNSHKLVYLKIAGTKKTDLDCCLSFRLTVIRSVVRKLALFVVCRLLLHLLLQLHFNISLIAPVSFTYI